MFPTRIKSRISHTLSYPVTAKEISQALADIPQATSLSIDFFHKGRLADRDQPYVVVSVGYGPNSLLEPEWFVLVRPVPRSLRHTANELLKQQAFPAMREWLFQRRDLTNKHGVTALRAIFYERDACLRLEHFQSSGEAFPV